MISDVKELWVDKYRPQTLKDYVLNSDIRQYFKNMIKNKSLQNFTLSGVQGSGKTTLAKIICNEFNAEVLFVKCATDGTLETLRTKIQDFCNAMSMDGKIKIVVLDEIDSSSSSGQNNFQLGLRTLIEAAQEDTRFILTCNLINKVFPAILSRCPCIKLMFDKKDLLIHVKKILDAENINYDKDSIKAFIEESFKYYPDCRRIINYLQFCCSSGTLVVKLNDAANKDNEEFVTKIIEKTLTEKNILEVRKYYLQHKEQCGDYLEIASNVFNYVVDNNLISTDGILKLTDMLYHLNTVVDRDPTFFGMLVAINKFKI